MRLFTALAGVLLLLPLTPAPAADWGALEYRNVGPARGGRVTAVAGTAAAQSTFYLGASGGGVWKTTDYGTSWHNVSDGYFRTPSIGAIAVSQRDPNIVFVGTGSDGLRSNDAHGFAYLDHLACGQVAPIALGTNTLFGFARQHGPHFYFFNVCGFDFFGGAF